MEDIKHTACPFTPTSDCWGDTCKLWDDEKGDCSMLYKGKDEEPESDPKEQAREEIKEELMDWLNGAAD